MANASLTTALRLRAQGLCRKEHEQKAADMGKHETGLETAWQELQTALDESLQGLSENYRAALVLCYLEGRTPEEAAQLIRCPVDTVRSRVARGRDLLRKHLARRGLTLSAGAFAALLTLSSARASLPAALLRPTLKAALPGATEKAMVSARVTALVETGMRLLSSAKMRIATGLLLFTVGAVGLGRGVIGN